VGPNEKVANAGSDGDHGKPAWHWFWKRRRFIVDPRFQGALMSAFIVQMLVFSSILTLTLFLPPILVANDANALPSDSSMALQKLLVLDDLFWPALAGAFLLALFLALRTSHQIAGPLYRFRHVFATLLAQEDPGPVRLRKGDYLKREAESLDRVVQAMVRDRERLAVLEERLRLEPEAAKPVEETPELMPATPGEGHAS
jgi:hypothetical protein